MNVWWLTLTGGSKKEKKTEKVRRGGPWNREMELYYALLEEDQIKPIDDTEAEKHQAKFSDITDKVISLKLKLN